MTDAPHGPSGVLPPNLGPSGVLPSGDDPAVVQLRVRGPSDGPQFRSAVDAASQPPHADPLSVLDPPPEAECMDIDSVLESGAEGTEQSVPEMKLSAARKRIPLVMPHAKASQAQLAARSPLQLVVYQAQQALPKAAAPPKEKKEKKSRWRYVPFHDGTHPLSPFAGAELTEAISSTMDAFFRANVGENMLANIRDAMSKLHAAHLDDHGKADAWIDSVPASVDDIFVRLNKLDAKLAVGLERDAKYVFEYIVLEPVAATLEVGDFGLSKKITELRKELRSFPTDEKMGDLDGRSKLRRCRVAVETVLSVQFGRDDVDSFSHVVPHLSAALHGSLKRTYDDTYANGEFLGFDWLGILTWIQSLLTPEHFTEAELAMTLLHEGTIRQFSGASVQSYCHRIKSEFRLVPDLTPREKLNFFRTGLLESVKLGSFCRRESGTTFETVEELFHYIQMDEARSLSSAKGQSIAATSARNRLGGYGFPNRKSMGSDGKPRFPGNTERPTGQPLALNRVHFAAIPSPPPADSDSDDSHDDERHVGTRGVDIDTDDRPGKSARIGPHSNGGRGGRGGRSGQPARPAHSEGGRHVRGAFGSNSIGRGTGRGYGQGAGLGRGHSTIGSGQSSAPDFSGKDPNSPMHMNNSVSVAQSIWLQQGSRCFWCFHKMAQCISDRAIPAECLVRLYEVNTKTATDMIFNARSGSNQMVTLADSGATGCLMAQDMAERLGLHIRTWEHGTEGFTCANEGIIGINGTATLPFSIQRFKAKFLKAGANHIMVNIRDCRPADYPASNVSATETADLLTKAVPSSVHLPNPPEVEVDFETWVKENCPEHGDPALMPAHVVRYLLRKFRKVFNALPMQTPKHRDIPHVIKTEENAYAPYRRNRRMSPAETALCEEYVAGLLKHGFITPSSSPYGAPIMIIAKPGGVGYRVVCDWRALNNITIKNRYPLPRIDETIDRLSGATIFSSLDLTSGYYQIRISDEDAPKTAFTTPMVQYEFKVLGMGLANAPAIFQAVMNKIFAPYLHKFVVVYLDDILVYGRNPEEHAANLEKVLQVLQDEEFYAKLSKCTFNQSEIKFLGHIIGRNGVKSVLSRRMGRWQETLAPFHYTWEYRAGRNNVADPISRNPNLSTPSDHDLSLHLMVYSLSVTECKPRVRSKKPITGSPLPIKSIMDRILEGYASDPLFAAGHKRLRDKFSRDGFWFKKSKHGRDYLCVPDNRVLKQDIIREQHDPIYMGHCGRTKTLELVTRTFTWDCVTDDVKDFIKRCHSCQTNKPGNLKPGGTLVPVEIPLQFWDCVSTDLITALPPTTSGHDAIAVFVDKLSKMVHVAPCSTTVSSVGFAAIYLDTVVRHHGIPKKLLSDRDARFTGHFGSELQRLMGTRQAFPTAFHPQTDGQTERMNRVIEDMIRHHVGPYHDDWDQSLALVEFAINNSWQESIQNTPFRAYLGYDPRTPMAAEVDSKCPAAKSCLGLPDPFCLVNSDKGGQFKAGVRPEVRSVRGQGAAYCDLKDIIKAAVAGTAVQARAKSGQADEVRFRQVRQVLGGILKWFPGADIALSSWRRGRGSLPIVRVSLGVEGVCGRHSGLEPPVTDVRKQQHISDGGSEAALKIQDVRILRGDSRRKCVGDGRSGDGRSGDMRRESSARSWQPALPRSDGAPGWLVGLDARQAPTPRCAPPQCQALDRPDTKPSLEIN
eukprot:gene5513-biopygen2579